MRRKEITVKKSECEHLWVDLGVSPKNGKRYRRCERCGTVKEETLPYIT